jgi:hypothetical protein
MDSKRIMGVVMKRAILVLLTVVIAAACQPQGKPDTERWFKGDYEQALAAAKDRSTLVMLDFHSDT